MSRIANTIFPIFFFIFLSVSTRTTLGEDSSDLNDKFYSSVEPGRSLQDEQENTKDTTDNIDLSMQQTNIQNVKEKNESFKEEGQDMIDFSDNNETLISKNNEEVNNENERAVMIQHLEELIENLSEYMKKKDKEQQTHDKIEQVYKKREIETRNRLPKRQVISTDGCLLTDVIPTAVTSVSSSSSSSSSSTSSSSSSMSMATASSSESSSSFSFPTPLPLEVLKQIECTAEAIEYGHPHLLSTIVQEILCEVKKLLHYLLHAFLNLLSEISIGPQNNLLEADVGSTFVEFLKRAPVIVEELLKEPQHLLALPEILINAIPLEDIVLTINRLKEDFLLLLERIYPAFSQLFERIITIKGKEIDIILSYVDAFKTFFLNLITSFTTSADILLSDVQIGPTFINFVKAVYDGYQASGIQETFINSQSPVTILSEQDEVLPVIPLSSQSTTSAAVTTTSTSEAEIVPIQEPLIPSVPVPSSEVSTSSSTSTTTVVSEPKILIEEIPSTITTTTTTTAAAAATAATGAVATTSAASSSSSNLLSPISNIDTTDVVSSSSSSSSSTSSVSTLPELDETVASTATSSSSSSSTLPELSKALVEPSFLSRVIPIISSISSRTKDLTSATSSAISDGNLLTDTTASSSSASSSSSSSLLSSINPVISTVSPSLTSSSASSSASSSFIDNYASPITRIENILPVTSTSSASSSSAVSTSSNPTIIVPSSPILNPYRRKFQVSSAVPAVTSLLATTSTPESSGISSSSLSEFPLKLKWPVTLPRNKVIAAIGNNNLVPGDIVLMTLKSNKTYFSRITDEVSPLTFEFLKPRMFSGVLNTFGRIWKLVPGDFNDINCESLFNSIY
ncbi:uncharacterized threonine-rich GPI-anchored glycoprotein PJ4664.02-like [Vespa velutina]|uniref:uncharacterized threonine-rich GPI-anchored glycoprotein PJ4664.02-like n=1 Tax=Vespa velutina TaxID=202808 RepID=UPI001FB5516C|nr:uncharacterized threonine-rich GPI-anchored glycoprotein PJ4664.02-like [Vespa velutina]